MRNIKYIVIHCTATPQDTTIESIRKYWKDIRKWGNTPGYHYLIKKNGEIVQLLDENQISYGSAGHNAVCVHIAYMGGIDKKGYPLDNRTQSQKDSMYDKIMELMKKYPEAKVLGHRDFPEVKKACPSFDVKKWMAEYVPKELREEHEEEEE